MAINISITYQDKTQMLHFDKHILSIGKNMGTDIFLNDKKISRHHAELLCSQGRWILKDLASTNGTYVNGKKIQEVPLAFKDQIQMGDTVLRLHPIQKHTRIHDKITDELKQCLEESPALFVPKETLKERLSNHMESLLEKNKISFLDSHEKKSYISQKLQEILGLGFLEEYLRDPLISEIMINGYKDIYIEKKGVIEKTNTFFESQNVLDTMISKILAPLGRHVDEASPIVDARLPDGSRINVILPPLSLKGPILTIRKFLHSFQTLEDLVNIGSISAETASFLKTLIHERKNILISGGTSSGKTTLLNALSNCIDPKERVITIEDLAELKLHKPHTVSLEARPSNIEGQGDIPIRRLVQNALRMRPDRIIIGECRGAETFDMLQAMNTGHEGCLTTLHANSPRDALKRLETLVLMTGFELPIKAIREQIASAIHIIIQTKRHTQQGKRTLTHITQLCGFEGDTILTQDLFNSTKGEPHVI